MAIQARTRTIVATTAILAILAAEIVIKETDSGATADAAIIKVVRSLTTPIGAIAHRTTGNGNG
jgi:hypothetical protein